MKNKLNKQEQAVLDSLLGKITEEELLEILMEPIYEELHRRGILKIRQE